MPLFITVPTCQAREQGPAASMEGLRGKPGMHTHAHTCTCTPLCAQYIYANTTTEAVSKTESECRAEINRPNKTRAIEHKRMKSLTQADMLKKQGFALCSFIVLAYNYKVHVL